MPSRTPIRARQSSSRSAFSTEGQRRWTSTSNDGRCSSSRSSGSLPAASQHRRAIWATVSSSRGRHVEVLVQGGRMGHRGDDAVGDVVDVRERPRLLAGAEDRQRAHPGERLAQQVGHRVRDAGLVVGHLARPVGVERPADRERQPELVVGGAAVGLARQLRPAVGRARRRAPRQVLLARRELLGVLEHHARGHVREALDVLLDRRTEDGVVERVVDLRQRERELVEVRDPADDRGQMDHVRAAVDRAPRLRDVAQVADVDLAALAHPVGRRPLVGHADLPVRIAQQPPDDGGADRAGAAGDEHAPHVRSAAISFA